MGKRHDLSDQEVMLLSVRPGTIFRHYKSTDQQPREYRFVALALHTETEEPMVVYEALYETEWQSRIFCRPAGMFFGDVEYDGVRERRFTPTEPQPIAE